MLCTDSAHSRLEDIDITEGRGHQNSLSWIYCTATTTKHSWMEQSDREFILHEQYLCSFEAGAKLGVARAGRCLLDSYNKQACNLSQLTWYPIHIALTNCLENTLNKRNVQNESQIELRLASIVFENLVIAMCTICISEGQLFQLVCARILWRIDL